MNRCITCVPFVNSAVRVIRVLRNTRPFELYLGLPTAIKQKACIHYASRMEASAENIANMRKPYHEPGNNFDVDNLVSKEPFEIFRSWFDAACKETLIIEPNAMALGTATLDGKPSVRMVLMKAFDKKGFKFFTNFNSRKGQELEANPEAYLMFYWPPFKRQIRIDGRVTKLPDDEAAEYFKTRPRPSQIGACVSNQSTVISSRQAIDEKRKQLEKLYDGKSVVKPEYWGGYLLEPRSFEFWQGQSDRLHDRILFRRPVTGESVDEIVTKHGHEGWVYERLYP